MGLGFMIILTALIGVVVATLNPKPLNLDLELD
jgi:hypothetical protein